MPLSSHRPARWLAVTAGGAVVASSLLLATPVYGITFNGGSTLQTLSDAIFDANFTAGADVITLTPGSTITGGGDTEVILDDVTIEMNGASVEDLRLFIVGADVTIRGGTWTALPSATAAAVAPGIGVRGDSSLTLVGMFVTATGSECDAAIGGWFSVAGGPSQCDSGSTVSSGAITITNSNVIATGGLFSAALGGGSRGAQGPITITDSTVNATGGHSGPGIGAGKDRVAGTIDIADSSVTATGGPQSAGIGGGDRGSGGTVSIDGGTVVATGVGNAAGIGGGFDGAGGTTLITGDAEVSATAGSLAAGIGGGLGGVGGSTTISGTATVTANGRDGAPGIGSAFNASRSHTTSVPSGSPTIQTNGVNGNLDIAADVDLTLIGTNTAALDGVITNAGTLRIDSPSVASLSAASVVTNSGVIDGSGQLRGSGTVDNQGIICAGVQDIATSPLNPATGLTVTGNAFYLPYSLPEGGSITNAVYASTLEDGCRSLPDYSSEEQVQVGWTIETDGPFITETSDLATLIPSRSATLEPVMVDAVLTIDPYATTSTAGDTVAVSVLGPLPLSNALLTDLTDRVTLSGDITAGVDPGTFVSTTAGEQIVTATVEVFSISGDRTLTGEFTHTTSAASLDALEVNASALTVDQGDSVTLEVVGNDEFGNEIFIFPGDVVVTSSVPTDIIDGLTVTFPTASPHVLTVTVGELSAQVTVEVEPAAVIPVDPGPSDPDPVDDEPVTPDSGEAEESEPELAVTGATTTSQPLSAAILLLALGGWMLLVGRTLTRRRVTR